MAGTFGGATVEAVACQRAPKGGEGTGGGQSLPLTFGASRHGKKRAEPFSRSKRQGAM